jgi:hypothetical protein
MAGTGPAIPMRKSDAFQSIEITGTRPVMTWGCDSRPLAAGDDAGIVLREPKNRVGGKTGSTFPRDALEPDDNSGSGRWRRLHSSDLA